MSLTSRIRNRIFRLEEQVGDRLLGITTAERHETMVAGHPELRGYQPTAYRDWRIIRKYIAAKTSDVFVDYGCGLGRITILAARLPFKRVIGIDFDTALIARADRNIKASKPRTPI